MRANRGRGPLLHVILHPARGLNGITASVALRRAALQVAVQASIQLLALQRLADELVHP